MASDLAKAISIAEGFQVLGSLPARAHNPGDLVLGDLGHGRLGAEGITVFQDDASGWAALEHQLDLIRTGKSHVYAVTMTIAQMAVLWTRTQREEWMDNVVAALRGLGHSSVTAATMLRDVL